MTVTLKSLARYVMVTTGASIHGTVDQVPVAAIRHPFETKLWKRNGLG